MARTVVGISLSLLLVGAGAAVPSSHPIGPQPVVSPRYPVSDVSPGANLEFPNLAFDGTNYLVVWSDYRGGGWDVLAARVSSQGTVLPPGEFTISSGPGSQEYPAVAWDGQSFLVTWVGDSSAGGLRVYGARVTRDGALLGQFTISGTVTLTGDPAVAFNGTNFLVAWTQGDDIYANRVTSDGAVLDGTGFVVSDSLQLERSPDVGTDGSGFLVAWQQRYSGANYMPLAARVSATGAVLDPDGLPLDLSPGDARGATVAFDGTRYLVAWADQFGGDVNGSRVTTDGVVLDPQGFSIAAGPTRESNPTVTWDGGVFETVWMQAASISSQADLRAARVSGDGTVLDPGGFPVAETAIWEWLPDASPGQLGRTALAYVESFDVNGPRQVFLRFLDRGPVAETTIAQPGDWFAFLHGYVNPNTQQTNLWFEWGRTEALGNVTPVQVVDAPGSVRADIYNLESGTSYYFRVVAENASGRGHGETKRFGTLTVLPQPVPPPPQPPPGPPPPSQVPPPVPRCRVPAVVGRSYRVARTRILRARCRVGRVRRARSRRRAGLVISQRPRAGGRFRPGTRINLVVSRGRR